MTGYSLAPQAYPRYRTLLHEIVNQPSVTRVCDVGGGARPSLSPDFVRVHHLKYHVLDISAKELAKTPNDFVKVQADICSPELDIPTNYDLVVSRFVAEHVLDGYLFHKNVWNILSENGYALHLFPTLYAIPFLINYLIPETVSTRLLDFFAPKARNKRSKFPARYNWCRGPTQQQIQRLQDLGYDVVEYTGFFGTPYLNRLKPVKRFDQWISAKLVRYPVPLLTSYACLLLHKTSLPKNGKST